MRMCAYAAILAAGGCFVSAPSWAQSTEPTAQPADDAPPAATQLPPLSVEATQAPKKSSGPKKKAGQKSTAPVAAAKPQPAAPSAPPGAATAGTGKVNGYVAEETTTGTKSDTPLREVPQSISVVGTEQMRDQGVQNLQEALRYVPGVVADGYGYDSRNDFALIRGTEAAYYIDGLRTNYGYYVNTSTIEPYALERVEVLRGPASMLYGQTPTGGIINGISKLPSAIPYNEITFEYGSFDFKQVKFDSTGALTNDGKWMYRVTGLVRDADTQVDYVENDRIMLAPSLTYRPTNDTTITVLGNFRDDHSGSTQQFLPNIGTLVPNKDGKIVPRSTFVGEPTDYYDTETQSGTLLIDHKLADGLKLHHVSRYTHTDNAYESHYAAVLTPIRLSVLGLSSTIPNAPFLDADQTEVARAFTRQFTETRIFNTDTSLTGTFLTGDVRHKVTGGADYMRYQGSMQTAGTLVDNIPAYGQTPFDIYNPQYGQTTYYLSPGSSAPITPDNIPLYGSGEVQTQTGIYLQDQLKLGPWIAVLGLRHDWLTIENIGRSTESETATTGRAALMYEFSSGITPYVSYSTSFVPQAGSRVADNIFAPASTWRAAAPIKGEQTEIGFKYQPKGLPFAVNASIYELNDQNRFANPDPLFATVQGADVKARGFEFEVIGAVTRELKVIATYSYTDATYEKYPELYSPASGISQYMAGKPVDYVPKHLASFWAIYSVQDGMLDGLSFGAGVRYVGASESYALDVLSVVTGSPQEYYVKSPAYTLFDAMVAYETEQWRWQLTAQNLEDEYYVMSCSAYRGDCGVGQGRTIITGLTYKF